MKLLTDDFSKPISSNLINDRKGGTQDALCFSFSLVESSTSLGPFVCVCVDAISKGQFT